MRPRGENLQLREMLFIAAPIVLVFAGVLWVASRFIEPAPPRTIIMTTGGDTGAYYAFGRRYARILESSGIKLEVHPSKGSIENVARLKDASSRYSVGLLQGGVADQKSAPELRSIGRMFLEPLWIFYRSDTVLESIASLRGKRIAIGAEGSGTRHLALQLLSASHIDAGTTQFSPLNGPEAVAGLMAGNQDAIFLVAAPEAPIVKKLLVEPTVKLMSLAHAEALTRRLPFLSRITLPRGVVDLSANIPERDIDLIAPVAVLAVREDLHPALVGLLVEAARDVHAPGGLFHRIGEFPRAADPELEMSEDAERVYKNGPPFLQRYLPFWLATFIERTKILIVPLLTLIVPLAKLGPAIWRWRIRRRLNYWYARLKSLEAEVDWDKSRSLVGEHRTEFARIEAAVATIPVPRQFAEQYYTLRAAIELVRQRIHAAGASSGAAPA